jgi:hypothetical protein
MAVCQNPVPLVNIKIAGKWMFIPLKMALIGIDPSPYNGIIVGYIFSDMGLNFLTIYIYGIFL